MENLKLWIDEWLALWPDDVIFNGANIKSPAKYCINKMVKLCKDNPHYTKDCIFAATKNYLAEFKAKNYAYIKRATYFISKLGEESLLEAYCNRLLKGVKEPEITPEYNAIDDFI